MNKKFYITTPVYYANAKPHIGHAYTTIAADVIVRFKKLMGEKAFLLTGMDEHGAKIAQKAQEENKQPQELVDEVSVNFKNLWEKLAINYSVFTRTTDDAHKKAIQKTLQRLYDKGVIYKGEYEGLYCVGCEQFKSHSDLVDGKCPDHDVVPETTREESYMMKMTEAQDVLIAKIENDEFKIRPKHYKNETLSFLKNQKLEDLSISRKNVSWGIPLPFDTSHTAYVWFDAFLSYVTGLGWDGEKFCNDDLAIFWPSDINLIGKDILRVHATIWPIMLMHLEMPVTRGLFTHGHILSAGKKMSKTLGNVIAIDEMIDVFGVDATRYLLLASGHFGEDVDITMERMKEKYNADLANGLGNLTTRIITLAQDIDYETPIVDMHYIQDDMDHLSFDHALQKVWIIVEKANKYIEEKKPWTLKKCEKSGDWKVKESEFENVMKKLLEDLHTISFLLRPFLPETSQKITTALKTREHIILFERIK